jgi:putative hydrolase of the HAD superfamily
LDGLNEELLEMNDLFEKGKITELQFIETFQKYIPTMCMTSAHGMQ